MRSQYRGKIYGKADLSADAGAGLIPAAEDREGDTQAVAKLIRPAAEALQLISAQSARVGHPAVGFGAKRQARAEVVQQREASRVHMAPRSLNPHYAGACISRKEESEI